MVLRERSMQSVEQVKFSLNSFIRLYAMDMAKQMAEVYKRLQQGGGYDFYRNLNLAIKAYIDGKTDDEIEYILNNASKPTEITYNKIGFESFKSKFGSKRKRLSTFDKSASVKLASGGLRISCSPSFTLETPAGLETYHVWASQSPEVNAHMGALACHLSREAFRRTSYSNHSFRLFDAVGNRSYSKIFNNTALISETLSRQVIDWANA